MANNFKECLEIILHHEGGYVNHPKDPGGETNLGVTKRVYEEHGGTKDMKDLTAEDVEPIYRKGYWDKCRCEQMPAGLDLCVFDFAVNGGPGRGARLLQQCIGAHTDGAIGPNTLAKLQEYITQPNQGSLKLIKQYQEARQNYYESLSTFDTFGRGWTRRNEETTAKAIEMSSRDD